MNLIQNSIKYAAGRPIRVSVARDGETALIQVSDSGPGIPAAYLPRIFYRFERAVSARHFAGMGLGLCVARQIAEAHGGSISATILIPVGSLHGELPGRHVAIRDVRRFLRQCRTWWERISVAS